MRKVIPLNHFPVFVRVRIQAPHVFVQKLIPNNFPPCIDFCAGGTHHYKRRCKRGNPHGTITNENLEILFCFRFRNGKANNVLQIFFRMCFRNDHVGHAQATTAGHAYKKNYNPRDSPSLLLLYFTKEKILNPGICIFCRSYLSL